MLTILADFPLTGDNLDKQLRILNGLHLGAQMLFARNERYVVGADPACSVVLCDTGVAPKHCLIAVDEYGATCRAIDAGIVVGGREVRAGEAVSLEDYQRIRCGPVTLSVGPVDGDWASVEEATYTPRMSPLDAVRSLKNLNPYALFAAVLVGITCVIGLAYAALSDGDAGLTPTRVEAARQWLKSIAPPGSELQIGAENPQGPGLLLSGYVPFQRQLVLLSTASRASHFKPRIDVYAVDEMVSSTARLAQLASIACEPQYKGDGQVACAQSVESDATATKLRMIARDVPGVRSLDVQVVVPPVVAAPAVASTTPPAPPTHITQKFSVLMFRNTRYLVGQYGKKYTEGQEFDGFTIHRIGIDKVIFERDGREFEFYVAALRTPG